MELIFAHGRSEAKKRQLSRGARAGKYLRLARGVYIDSAEFNELAPWEQHRAAAIAFGAGRSRIIAGRSAALLWGMWANIRRNDPVEYYLSRGYKSHQGYKLPGRLSRADWTQGRLCNVTNIPRTLLDLARHHSFEDCFMAANWVLINDACSASELQEVATKNETLQRVLQLVDPYVESAAEAYFLAQVRKAGVIHMHTQVSVVDSHNHTLRPDFQIHGTRVLIEISGLGKYGNTTEEQQFNVRRATDRLNRLATVGYTIWTYSAVEVFSGEAYNDVLQRYQRMSATPSFGWK